jgi:hypothetical protein
LDFLLLLTQELADDLLQTKQTATTLSSSNNVKGYFKNWSDDISRLHGIHLPIEIKLDQPTTTKKDIKRNYKRGH